jgi:shikimate kinase
VNLFLIGPGGVGKSTSGPLLAERLGYRFVDVDREFCARIANISEYIGTQGYVAYCHANADLIERLLEASTKNTVFAMPSGCLVHDECPEVALRNAETLRQHGLSILLLPSRSVEESTELIVARQLGRGFGLNGSREREKYRNRHPRYLAMGDIQVFSCESPTAIAAQMQRALIEQAA